MKELITKSKFMQARRCPKMAYMELNHPEEAKNKKTTSLGTFFGQEARKAFKAQVTIRNDAPENMANHTQMAISNGFDTIAEASFMHDGLFCSCDIFRIISGSDRIAEIYEVKSTTDYHENHISDIAFQVYILESCGWIVQSAYIVTVDSSYINEGGEADTDKVFKKNDVTSQVRSELLYIPEEIEKVKNTLESFSKTAPSVSLGEHCKCGFECPFLDHCVNSLSADVFNLGSMRFSTKVKLYNNNVRSYDDIIVNAEKFKISASSVVQAQAHLSGEDIVNKEKIKNFIQTFKFPLYFLDFESFQMAMPVWENSAAYQQIPFQYSLHKMGASGKLVHMEFIGEPGKDPRRAIAESLCKNIKNKGTILAYNSGFEKTRIKELAALFPDLKKQLLRIDARIDDLMVPFQKRWFYKAAQNGSYSIKAVLPALYPNDPRLDYHKLNIVHNGTEAMVEYCNLGSYSEEDRKLTIEALLRYCELDTYALVLVYEYLRTLVL